MSLTIFCPRCKSAITLEGSEREANFYQQLSCKPCLDSGMSVSYEALDNANRGAKKFIKELTLRQP